MNRLLAAIVAVVMAATLVAGCSKGDGRKLGTLSNPTEIAGKPITYGPSGFRQGAPGPTRKIENTDNGEIDQLAAMAISDVEEFWTGAYGPPLQGKFTPVNAVFSWDPRFKHGTFCGNSTFGFINAQWCDFGRPAQNCPSDGSACRPSFNTIGWDRGALMPDERAAHGDMAVALVLAHEYGHAISWEIAKTLKGNSLPVYLASEQQADCFAGVYMRWVVDGKSRRFTLTTGDGLTNLLVALVGLRDPLVAQIDPTVEMLYHGSAFERVTAFQFGFADGISACTKMTAAEVEQRRKNLPKDLLEQGQTGEFLITQDSVRSAVDALNKQFSPENPPVVSFDQPSCPDARTSPPASYCPSTNTINVDMNKLVVMGTSLGRGTPLDTKPTVVFGDYTAYSVLLSRYMLAMQNQRGGLSLDNESAGMRTACLTGVATTKLVTDPNFKLSGGDLDEAVTGVLTNGMVAANVNGDSVPSAFARLDAFRTGVLGDEDRCYKRWQ